MLEGSLLFLGTGSSFGVPVVACDCPVCTSRSIYNKRLRTSALIKCRGNNLLIDAGPDVRMQALRYGIDKIDGVLLTHPHYDHVGGLDDLRIYAYKRGKPLPCYVSSSTFAGLKKQCLHITDEDRKLFDFRLLPEENESLDIEGINVRHVSYTHMGVKVSGFCFDHLAYITDIKEYSPDMIASLQGVHTLIISALRWEESPGHFSVDDAVQFAQEVGAKETYLTHIAHDLEHVAVQEKLPSHVYMSYDGLEIGLGNV